MELDFLGYRFLPVGIEHRARLAGVLARHPQRLSDYCFSSLLVWSPVYRYHHTVVEPDTLLVSSVFGAERAPSLLQPVGEFPDALQETLLRRARELPEPLRIESVSEAFLARHAAFARHFEVTVIRDSANYVYAAGDLAELRGRRYAGKRNQIAQASRLHSWSVEALDPPRVGACLEFSDDIAAKRTTQAAVTLAQETEALASALRAFEPLGLQGLLVRVGGKPSAFSIFDRLNATTAVVLFERARRSEKGLYQVINRETARVIAAQGFSLINREEDLGDPGLRKAKLSYHPVRLETKHTLTLRA
ncbi:MAG: DUF2156 domain-containing protein [Acidobacteria bacterium]|nr:MAG: DUF2156 domain-containing protein [Acidobacteriota bacterium]